MTMYKALLSSVFLAFFLCNTNKITAQDRVFDLGFEFQAYPTGLIPGLRLESGFGEQRAVHLRLGYYWLRHQGFGVKEEMVLALPLVISITSSQALSVGF